MGSTIRRKQCKTYYLNGKWMVEVQCVPEYNSGTDSLISGCEAVYTISEDELECGSSKFRSNVMLGWTCKYCNKYHVLLDFIIPEHVKDSVFYRKHPQKQPVIINFSNYKKRKGKD